MSGKLIEAIAIHIPRTRHGIAKLVTCIATDERDIGVGCVQSAGGRCGAQKHVRTARPMAAIIVQVGPDDDIVEPIAIHITRARYRPAKVVAFIATDERDIGVGCVQSAGGRC